MSKFLKLIMASILSVGLLSVVYLGNQSSNIDNGNAGTYSTLVDPGNGGGR